MILPDTIKREIRLADAHTVPRGDDDLHEYIRAYLGYHVPRRAVCQNHVAPFSFIVDVFFERECNVLVFASRSGGKTQNIAILDHLNAIHKPLYEIASVGAVKEQANKCYDYIRSLGSLDWFSMDVVFSIKSKTLYRNGSNIQVLTGSMAGCNSPHPLCVVCDEVELMSWDILQEAYCMAQSKHGYKAVQILSSTRKFATGNMFRLLVEKPREPSWPFRTYTWCVFEAGQRCTLPDCEQCKRVIRIKEGEEESWYDICHEDPERHPDGKLRASDGFLSLEDIWTKFVTTDWDLFDAQYRCLKPGRKGLVFAAFSQDVHCDPSQVAIWRERLNDDSQRRALEITVTMDMGWADPLAVLFVARDKRDNLFLFDCIYERELDLRDLVPLVQAKFAKYRLPYDLQCYCDERAPREIDELNKMGLRVSPIGIGVEERVSLIRKWLNGNYREGQTGVWIDPDSCWPLIRELETLKLKMDKAGNPKGELPDKGPDHLIDCWGYAYSAFGISGGQAEIKLYRVFDSSDKHPPAERRGGLPTDGRWVDALRTSRWGP